MPAMNDRPQRIFPTSKGHGARFARIDNALLRDKRLSFLARGVAASLLSRPHDWQFSAKALAAEGQEGGDSLEGAIHELEIARHVQRRKQRDPATGHITTVLTFHESPTTENRQSVPTTGLPAAGQPTGRSTGGRQTGCLKNDRSKNDGSRNDSEGESARLGFPFPSWDAVPAEARDRILRDSGRGEDFCRAALEDFRGRKLYYRDKYATISEWVAVVASAIKSAAHASRGGLSKHAVLTDAERLINEDKF